MRTYKGWNEISSGEREIKKLKWLRSAGRKCASQKHKGGMGFRNLQAFNLAMLSKQAWHILTNPNSLIARIYKAKYFPYSDIMGAKLGCNASYT